MYSREFPELRFSGGFGTFRAFLAAEFPRAACQSQPENTFIKIPGPVKFLWKTGFFGVFVRKFGYPRFLGGPKLAHFGHFSETRFGKLGAFVFWENPRKMTDFGQKYPILGISGPRWNTRQSIANFPDLKTGQNRPFFIIFGVPGQLI